MSDHYDRQGQPMTFEEWGQKFHDRAYKRVAETTLPDGKWVSTVWLGLDHGYSNGPPIIFETMVFPNEGSGEDLDCERYSTEAEAIAGHAAMAAKWTATQSQS